MPALRPDNGAELQGRDRLNQHPGRTGLSRLSAGEEEDELVEQGNMSLGTDPGELHDRGMDPGDVTCCSCGSEDSDCCMKASGNLMGVVTCFSTRHLHWGGSWWRIR